MSDVETLELGDLAHAEVFADLTAPTESEMNLQYALLVLALERAEAAFYADKTPETQAAWEQAQAELRACRILWRSVREVATGFVAAPVLTILSVPENLSEGA